MYWRLSVVLISVMKNKRPDLSSLNHIPLTTTETHYEVRRHEATGMIQLNALNVQSAERPTLIKRIFGKRAG